MSSVVDTAQAQRLREAETRWLQQSAERLRAAHVSAHTPGRPAGVTRTEDER